MVLNIYKKTIIIAIIVLFIGSNVISSATTSQLIKNNIEIIENFDSNNLSNQLIIKEIKDGFGITYILSNEGSHIIHNISINTEAFGRFIKIKSPKKLIFPCLRLENLKR